MYASESILKDGRKLIVREATAEDAPAVLAYLEDVCGQSDYLSFGPGEFDLTLEQEQAFLQAKLESANSVYLVGLIEDNLAGSICFEGGTRARVKHLGELGITVRKEYWGVGVGSSLMDALLSWARDTDVVTKVNLRVRTDNPRALALYRSKGFVLEGTISRELLVNGVYYDDYWMGLEL